MQCDIKTLVPHHLLKSQYFRLVDLINLCHQKQLKDRRKALNLANYFSTTFIKVTFGYKGVIPQKVLCKDIHRKYEYFEDENRIFGQQHGCFTASLEIRILKG